jgi:hypothetical protein
VAPAFAPFAVSAHGQLHLLLLVRFCLPAYALALAVSLIKLAAFLSSWIAGKIRAKTCHS